MWIITTTVSAAKEFKGSMEVGASRRKFALKGSQLQGSEILTLRELGSKKIFQFFIFS